MVLFFVLITQAPAKKTIPPTVSESVTIEKVINVFFMVIYAFCEFEALFKELLFNHHVQVCKIVGQQAN